MTLLILIIIILLLTLLTALYVAAEFAAVSARRTSVQALADGGNRLAQQLFPYLADAKKLDRYIAACQIGITVSSLGLGFYGQAQLAPYLGFGLSSTVSTVLALILLTSLQVVFGELLPKSLAMRYPERTAIAVMTPILWSLLLFRPLIAFFNGSALALMRLLGLERRGNTHVHSPEELEYLFRESASGGYLDNEEKEMLENVFQLEERLARQVMIPRTRVVIADGLRPAGELLRELAQTPHMRFPVFEGSRDHIIGILNLKDLFALARRDEGADVRSILRPTLIAPETNTVGELWEAMQQRNSNMAVLFDEYGGVAGIVTQEDIIEEIVGEVQDEFDNENRRIAQEGMTIRARGDVLISILNRKFLLNLPQERADTIGGLVMEVAGRVPQAGEHFEVEGIRLLAERVENNAVTSVSLVLPEPEAQA